MTSQTREDKFGEALLHFRKYKTLNELFESYKKKIMPENLPKVKNAQT